VVFALAGRAGAAWECRTEHFRVISEAGPEAAQAAAAHLEGLRRRFAALGLPLPEAGGGPVIVLVFAARQSLFPYAPADSRDPALTRGLSLPGQERNWIAVVWETAASLPATLAHEYAHLTRRDLSDPLWLREGLAEYAAGWPADGVDAGLRPVAWGHLRLLREQAWSGWGELLAAHRRSAAYALPVFYSQAWLAVHWLAAQGISPALMQADDLESLLRSRGEAWVDAQLRAYLEQLATENSPPRERGGHQAGGHESGEGASAELPLLPEVRPAEGWVLPYWKAEWHRELDHWDEAEPALEALERDYPLVPEPSEALGALLIAQGRYELAEQKLRAAVRKGSRAPATHHRYSLMLLRPLESGESPAGVEGGAAVEDRVAQAVWHARLAREAVPAEPRYVLGEAQALLVAGQWEPAARLLRELRDHPGWAGRSEVEFAELLRRRQQVMRRVPAPEMAAEQRSPARSAPPAALVAAWRNAVPPRVPKPKPARVEPGFTWPPPGTVLLYGYIQGVECRASEKIVTVRTPRFTIELRENAASPAKLYHPPSRWTELPCGLRGREVNVVYRPLLAGGEVRGELVAVVF
jgi:hypothetical protein